MTLYRILNTELNAWGEIYAKSSPGACDELGWDPYVCWVEEYSDKGGWKKPVDHPELGSMPRRLQ